MNKLILSAVVGCCLFTSNGLFAEDIKAQPQLGTTVTLSASDKKKVEQDLLVASLRIEIDNKNSRQVQDEINKSMKLAVDLAKTEPAIKVSTGNYFVYSYDPNPSPQPLTNAEQQKRMIWKGSQTIDLQSKDSEKILSVLGKIQDMGFIMNGLNYSLSPELAEAQKDELLVGALKKIKSKAELVAKTLGKSGYDIIDVTIDGSYMPQPQPVMMSMARGEMTKSADMSNPVAALSEADVSLNVTARVALKP